MQLRELTGTERRQIRNLVKTMCANYDNDYGCLLLDGDCYMFYGTAYTNSALCKWFRNAVMPLEPVLERIFTGSIAPDTKPCAVCGGAFPVNGRQTCCSDKCRKISRRKSVAKNVKAHRGRKRRDVII